MRIIWLVFAIILLTFGTYYAISYITAPPAANRIGDEVIQLNTKKQVATNVEVNKSWNNTPGSTLIFYISPTITDRTSVSGNEYATAIQIGNLLTFNILVAPDAGQGSLMAPARLNISVNGKIESIDITSIPLQRWSSVVIVKQGRIFNIYVNGRLTNSYSCTAMPDSDPTQALKVGDQRLGGIIALMSLAAYPMQASDVRALVRDTVDTDGKPYLSSNSPTISLPSLKFSFMCPGGNCNTPKKAGPMEQWQTVYA